LARKTCNKKLEKFKDIGHEKYDETEKVINNILLDLELIK
jgi:hypothetical protein